MHAPFTPVYEDSLIAIASYTVGRCDDTNSISIATNVRKFTKWMKLIRKNAFCFMLLTSLNLLVHSEAFTGTTTVDIDDTKAAGSKKKNKAN